MTLHDAATLFLTYGRAERNYAPQTLGKLNDCLRSWILPILGPKRLSDIGRVDIIQFRSAMVEKGIGTNRSTACSWSLSCF